MLPFVEDAAELASLTVFLALIASSPEPWGRAEISVESLTSLLLRAGAPS
jgi:hypothetical protein